MLEFLMIVMQGGTAQPTAFVPARDRCPMDALAVDLGFDPNGGSVEIMTPLADTDGKHPHRVPAQPVICVSNQQLGQWIERAGEIPYGTRFEVTYDPSGTPLRMRSQYDYSVMMCDELANVREAPPDLMLGHFEWSPESGIRALRVRWERDFRSYLERTCI